VRRDRLDVFFAPAYACPLSLSVPRVTTIHDLSFFSQPEDFTPLDGLRRRILVGLSLGASRRIVAVSDFTRREIVGRRPDADGRVDVIPHGADDDLPPSLPRSEARERLGVAGPFLVSVGSILNRRRLPALLQAMALVARAHPSVLLDVVGENRTHPRLDLSRIVERLRLEERVRSSGFVSDEDLALRYAAADGAVYLSEYEGFGLPVLEAMARGLPVLTSQRPATGEIFRDAALTIDPGEAEGIADAIDRLLHDTELRSRLTVSGRSLAARHTWADAAARTRSALAMAAR
jgi:glycosyltransferase involved in cell wall biosynthesis